MKSYIKLSTFILVTLFLTSCSSVTRNTQNRNTEEVDFEAFRHQTQTVLAKTSDLKKYKMSKVSF